MPWMSVEEDGKVIRQGDDRIVVIPKSFVLAGECIKIRQEKSGEITIYPASPEGWKAIEKFHPFGDWEDEDEER